MCKQNFPLTLAFHHKLAQFLRLREFLPICSSQTFGLCVQHVFVCFGEGVSNFVASNPGRGYFYCNRLLIPNIRLGISNPNCF